MKRRACLNLQSLECRDVPSGNRMFAMAEDFGGGQVAVYEATGPKLSYEGTGRLLVNFEPFPGFRGGVRVALGDVTGDGIEDVVVAAGKGGGPHVKVYDGAALLQNQTRVASEFFAFEKGFTGGVFVAVGQFDPQTPVLEIAVGAGDGGGPHVKTFNLQQVIYTLTPGTPTLPPYFFANMLNTFFAFDAGFRGGVRVAAGDITGDGRSELIAAAGPTGGPHVRAFDVNPPNPLAIYTYIFKVVDEFFAFDSRFRGGVYVAAGELDGNSSRAEIVVGAGEGGGPHMKVYGKGANGRLEMFDEVFDTFGDLRGGIRVGVANLSRHTDRQSIFLGRGPIVDYILPTYIPPADFRLAGFTFDSGQLSPDRLEVPVVLYDHIQTALVVGL